jgi:hypothetical protein
MNKTIVEAEDEAAVRALLASERVKAGVHTDEFYPKSHRSIVRKPKLPLGEGMP